MSLSLGLQPQLGGRTLIQRAIASLRARGTDAHLWLPGVGTVSGLTTGNYLESTGNTLGTVDNPVGLVLDALGTVGTELWSDTGVTVGAGWAQVGNAYTHTAGSIETVSRNIGLVAGVTYEVSATCSGRTAGSWYFAVGGSVETTASTTNGVVRSIIKSGVNALLYVQPDSAFNGVISNISVREVSGIHLTQGTTQNKPLLRRGLTNLLTYSSDFSNAAWTVVDSATKTATTCTFAANATSTVNNLCVVSGGTASKTFTAAVKVSCASGTVPFRIKNTHSAVLDNFSGEMLATTTPTIFVFTVTNSGSAGNGVQTIGLINSAVAPVVNTLTVDGVGLFQGSYTSQQILAAGGIPVTTTAAASNPDSGRYAWSFDGSNDTLGAAFASGALASNMDCFIVVKRNTAAQFLILNGTGFVAVVSGSASSAADTIPGGYTWAVDGAVVADTRDALHTALTVGVNHIFEARNLNLSSWTSVGVGGIGGFYLNGEIGEVILTAAMSDADRTLIRSYLASKHGVTL